SFYSDRFWKDVEINIVFLNSEEIPVAQINSSIESTYINITEGQNRIELITQEMYIATGVYYASITIFSKEFKKNLIWLDKVIRINFLSDFTGVAPYLIPLKTLSNK